VAYAARGLRAQPGFALSIVFIFALAIGANSTMFSLLDTLLLRPPVGVADPESAVRLAVRRPNQAQIRGSFSYVNVEDFRRVSAFESVAGATSGRNDRANVSLGTGTGATGVRVVLATGNYFSTLGVRPAAGRLLAPADDDELTGDGVAVIGYGFWQRRFAGSRDVIGHDLDIGGKRFRVVGVAPEGFSGIELDEIDAWLPFAVAEGLRFDRRPDWKSNRNATWVQLVARLKREVSPRRAASEATSVLRAFEHDRLTASGASRERLAAIDSQSIELVSLVPGQALAMYTTNDLPRDAGGRRSRCASRSESAAGVSCVRC
jgi:hypothetical protein